MDLGGEKELGSSEGEEEGKLWMGWDVLYEKKLFQNFKKRMNE